LFLITVRIFQSDNSIFSWIESHSVTAGIITTAIIGSLWFYKFLRQKRAEAFFGFYARLMLQLKSLRAWLDEKDLLEIDNTVKGNIYALIYDDNTRQTVCNAFHILSDEEFEEVKELALQLKRTLVESENNVYPKASDRTKWYNNQQVLFEFCNFIERGSMRKNTNIPTENSEYKHTIKCRKLVDAINYIQASIENENY